MKNRVLKALTVGLLIVICSGCPKLSRAAELKPITLAEALDLVFEQNTSHALFLWEQELLEKREALEKHPKITARTEPAGVRNGKFAGPEGSISLNVPLGQYFELDGTIRVGFDEKRLDVKPTGSLTLNYNFFALPETETSERLAQQQRQAQVNTLVLQTVDQLVQLKKKLDLSKQEEAHLKYLEASLEAARLTPNYDDLDLRKDLRKQAETLADIQKELQQLQLQLGAFLGESEGALYDPQISTDVLELDLAEEELKEEVFASSPQLQEAKARLTRAQQELDLERKTRGWDLKASGDLNLNQSGPDPASSQPVNWKMSLTATKTLYPRNIVLEELELAAAQAEHDLEMQESALLAQLRSAVQGVRSARAMVQLKSEHLAEAQADLKLRHRQYEAGLVTELQVQETALALQRAADDHAHSKMDYAQRLLDLWNLCGRDLRSLVFAVIN